MTESRETAPTIRVNAVMADGNIALMPLHAGGFDPAGVEGLALMQRVLDGAPDTLTWNFNGARYRTPIIKDELVGVWYACGGQPYTKHEGNSSSTAYRGAIYVYFDLTAVVDETARDNMRNFGFYAGVTVLPGSTPGNMLLGVTKKCKLCDGQRGQLVRGGELEWQACDACAAVCDHEYVWGPGNYNGQLAQMRFCKTCGRGDPSWQPSDVPGEDLVNVVTKGGVNQVLMIGKKKSLVIKAPQ